MAWDAPGLRDPELGPLPGHLILPSKNGIYTIENLALEELDVARGCRFDLYLHTLEVRGGRLAHRSGR